MADYMSHGTEEQKWDGTDHVWPSSRDTTGAVVTDLSIYHGHDEFLRTDKLAASWVTTRFRIDHVKNL